MITEEKIKEALEQIRPQLQEDGGDLEFVSLEPNGKVFVRLVGACGSCPMATMTLKQGVETFLREAFPNDNLEVVRAF
ncbi:MAG: NifU family protein [Treponema sp.]|nr:NifU family protein [Treponema sp.]